MRLEGVREVIPNGIDLTAFSLLPKRPVVAGAGRLWDAAKNLTALEAVAPGLDWPVEIAGDVEHPESGTANFVNARLVGRLTSAEMARQLGAASIFVAPAVYEPFGLAILEAAAAGCALVLGDIASLRENWDGAALFVDPEDRPALQLGNQPADRQCRRAGPAGDVGALPRPELSRWTAWREPTGRSTATWRGARSRLETA